MDSGHKQVLGFRQKDRQLISAVTERKVDYIDEDTGRWTDMVMKINYSLLLASVFSVT